MKILMLGNTASIGWNLKKGLEREGHRCDIKFVENQFLDGESDKEFLRDYDVLHVHYPVQWWKLRGLFNLKKGGKVVLHWHGSDARLNQNKLSTIIFKRLADANIVSTPDLNWWIRGAHYLCQTIDTEEFRLSRSKKKRKLIWDKGTGFKVNRGDVPLILGHYKEVTVYPSQGLSPHLLSVSALEALACGCKVTHHLDKDRNWIIKNASIPVTTRKLIKIYKEIGCEL